MIDRSSLMRLLLAAVAVLPLAAHAFTADELVAKNLDARGGAAKLRALKSAVWTGTLRFNGGGGMVDAGYTAEAKAPGKVRSDVSIQGFVNVYAYDGKLGWKVEPGGGRRDAERLSADDSKSMIEDAEFTGFLVDWKAHGCTLDYLGTDDVDGTAAHKLRVTRPNGDFHYVFLDPDHFLEIRIETHRWIRGHEEVTVSDLGEYEQVDGTYWPFLYATGPKGQPPAATIQIEHLALDAPVDDAIFRLPGSK